MQWGSDGKPHSVVQQWLNPPLHTQETIAGPGRCLNQSRPLSKTCTYRHTWQVQLFLRAGFLSVISQILKVSFSHTWSSSYSLFAAHALSSTFYPPFLCYQLPSVHLTKDRLEPVIYLALQWSQADWGAHRWSSLLQRSKIQWENKRPLTPKSQMWFNLEIQLD